MSLRPIILLGAMLWACGDESTPDGGASDASTPDRTTRDRDLRDVPDQPDGDVVLEVGTRDGGTPDVMLFDGGSGNSCEQATAWAPVETPYVDTTTRSLHLNRFECAGFGGAATAPEQWIETRFAEPRHLVLRLGTAGWDAVLAVRTATCSPAAEVACVDDPTVVELPAVTGSLFLGVEGFTQGEGPFVLLAQSGPPLAVPPTNSVCTLAPDVPLPLRTVAHNFGADFGVTLGCGLTGPVFYPFELAAPAAVTVSAMPQSMGDVSVAILSDCGDTVVCAGDRRAGQSEVLRNVQLPAGRHAIAVGTDGSFDAQSVLLAAAVGAECARDADCPLGEHCAASLACAPTPGAVVMQQLTAIPDDGAVEIPLPVAFTGRPVRVRLRLALTHPFSEDLVVTLTAPQGGPSVRLRDRLDGALDSVYGKDRPADGPGSLADFGLVGTASGTWTLRVEDGAPGDVGAVTGVVLEVE